MPTTIDNGARLAFESTFMHLAQQRRSLLESSAAVKYIDPNAKVHNIGSIGKVELINVEGRNPLKQYDDYMLDNRQFTKERFTKTILLDEKQDVNELIKDPTSDLMQELVNAKNRVIDRVIVRAAGGDALIGRPDRAPSAVSAADDGVITVDASAGLTATKISEVFENAINAELDMEDIRRMVLLISGRENTALMSEEKFINNDYISSRPIEKGYQDKVSGFNVVLFAGNTTGGRKIENPVLEETGTERYCLALAPDAVAVMMKLAKFDVMDSPIHVNSKELTIDFWIGATRTQGARVQKIKTTI